MNEQNEPTIDESNQIEELLDEWYDWQSGYTPNLGHGRGAATCQGFAEDDRTETAEERAEKADRKAAKRRAELVDVCVDALAWQERAAIQQHMKAKRVSEMNRECGVRVWLNPRRSALLDAHATYQQAKRSILGPLKRRGLLKCPELL
ncbi:hypothetical protein AQ925_20175 [Burkholderia pseudomallei]|uniref:hypothetical protein n=2 Tax=Burkholderia pseudomallei TaxID=28450 RepID=UPI00097545EB|nr:hypothetical protein [Burkholderia pseudomallei]ONC90792.1 hypothetical protein AQ925_20175 [Burkholderia pseudomallei]OND09146.1 hypothetical protein AQ926_01975 [Burkholderia pseudomallei]OND19337.1 hypothetical protein AQ930_18995 [Burkholderia pseudomallei]